MINLCVNMNDEKMPGHKETVFLKIAELKNLALLFGFIFILPFQ